jgi:tetratricopeptide (TPR) repeat protein
LAGSGDEPRWRVFISHTSELRDFPKGTSFVAAAERAISAAGHVIVDMTDFPAAGQAPADLCAERVRGCDVYVGILGSRYGSPVSDRPDVSYTELEFGAATEAGLDRLVFLLDTEADDVGIPLSKSIDREFGDRQDAFRDRVRKSKLVTQAFANPDALQLLVERSLRGLADTRRRIGSGIQREQVPAEPRPVRASRFVNPPPTIAPAWFQDRQVETGLLARYVTDPAIRLVTVTGRGGIGKTAMVCRLLRGLETGRIPDVEGDLGTIAVGGIVYLSRHGIHQVDYPTVVADLLRLLPARQTQRLRRLYQDPQQSPAQVMLAVLEAFPAGRPVVVLLDNLESVMDAEREALAEPALAEALGAVLTAPAHAVTVIATTRVVPAPLLRVEPSRQRQLRLNEGLGSPDAQIVLRELDDDGRLGLRDAPDDLLDELRQHTRGFPRALEAVKAILDGDETLGPRDLLDRTRHLPEDEVVKVLVGEAYELLDGPAQQVMQALAVYPAPVSAVGVDFLLRPVSPTTDAAPILVRLVRRQLARFQDGHYHLHPIDREYARGRLSPGSPGDSPAAFTLSGLQARAADYYAQIRTPRESWRSLEDIRPQLAEFELRCDTGDFNTAVIVLSDIDFRFMQVWGHYRTLIGLHARIQGQVSDPRLDADHLNDLGLCHCFLAEYARAIELHTAALVIYREHGYRWGEGACLTNLANCRYRGGEYRQALELHVQALAIFRETGDRWAEGTVLGNVAICHDSLGEHRLAVELGTQALAIAREIGDRLGEDRFLGNLSLSHLRLGEFRLAAELVTQALAIAREAGDRAGEPRLLGNLASLRSWLGEYQPAAELGTQALVIAREIGDRYAEATVLEVLGRAWVASGEPRRAVTVLEEAVRIADAVGASEPAAGARSALARAHLQLGDPAAALAAATAPRMSPQPAEEPILRVLAGLALLELHRPSESDPLFRDAELAADELLALTDRNVAALEARALALSGLAAIAGDQARATEAEEAFTRARAATSAPGVVADTRRLLDMITAHDQSGVLARLGAPPGE